MKITKPNITGGNWFVAPRSRPPKYTVCEVPGYDYVGANGGKNVDETPDADAKAISAVPNMIDALIEAQDELERFVISKGIDSQKVHVIKTIKSALEKAGCTYEP